MATEKISGFDIQSYEPIDARTRVADTAGLEAAGWHKYTGMVVLQDDTQQFYRFISADTTAATVTATDWQLIAVLLQGTGAPSDGFGSNGDFYFDTSSTDLYLKASGTWGNPYADLSGSTILTGATDPAGGTGSVGDVYIQTADGATYFEGDLFEKTGVSTWTFKLNIKGTAGAAGGDTYAATSTTSVAIPTSHPTDVALTLDASTHDYTPGQSVIAAEDSTNYFKGIVKTYSASILTITSTSNTGTGTNPTTSWTVNLDGASQRPVGKPGVPDKTYDGSAGNVFNEAEITSVIGDTQWNADNPFIAYVITDSRASKSLPDGITTDQTGNLIKWNGTAWSSIGRIRGVDGIQGEKGWAPVYAVVTVSSDVNVLKITGWVGGSGQQPGFINYYVGSGGLVSNINLATNIKGTKGLQGDPGDVTSVLTRFSNKSTNFNSGTILTSSPQIPYQSFYLAGYPLALNAGSTMALFSTNVESYLLGDEVWISCKFGVRGEWGNQTSSMATITSTLQASLDGSFSPIVNPPYSLMDIAVSNYTLYNYQCIYPEVETAFKVPLAGKWSFRTVIISEGEFSRPLRIDPRAVVYKILNLNRL